MRETATSPSSSTHWTLTSDHRLHAWPPHAPATDPPNRHHHLASTLIIHDQPSANLGSHDHRVHPNPSSSQMNDPPTSSDHHHHHHRHHSSTSSSSPSSSRSCRRRNMTSSATPPLTRRYGKNNNNNKDTEGKRKQRIASYNAYSVESKIKASVRSSFQWMKDKYNYIVYGC